MTELPIYLEEETEATILQRMLDSLPTDLDKNEGSYLHDAVAPAAIELALAAIWAQGVLQRGFATTTFDEYLDLRCEEHGLTRRAAVKATGQVLFTGVPSTSIPAATEVGVPADPGTDEQVIEYVTTESVTIPGGGTVYAHIEAVEAGANGNVAAGTITAMISSISGVTAVTNPSPTFGGLDAETDAELLTRYLYKVRHPSAGGNKADYANWAMEVVGVGAVAVFPLDNGPGTVGIYLLASDMNPASQNLADEVQNYIAPGWSYVKEAEDMALHGFGVSIDGTLPDDYGDSVKMAYDIEGGGQISHENLDAVLAQPGIWQAQIRAKVDSVVGTADLLQIGIWNVSAGTWATTRPEGFEPAFVTLRASDWEAEFGWIAQDFAWNGVSDLELRITRLTAETATTVWVDQVQYQSRFSRDTGEGKAPIGASVTVSPAKVVGIEVEVLIMVSQGYDPGAVINNVIANIRNYVKSLASGFGTARLVRYVYVGQAILVTPGVSDYTDLLVNGGVDNIPVDERSVAILTNWNIGTG